MSHPVITSEHEFSRSQKLIWDASLELLRLARKGDSRRYTCMQLERYRAHLQSECDAYDQRVHGDRQGPWIALSAGQRFWPMDPRPQDFDIGPIAHGLARINRFNGRTSAAYSVAQHSVHVHDLMPDIRDYQLYALLHDASEAYIQDIISPLKGMLGNIYSELESRTMLAISQRFGFPLDDPEVSKTVKWADEVLLVTEIRDLMPEGYLAFCPPQEPMSKRIVCMDVGRAQEVFLERFQALQS